MYRLSGPALKVREQTTLKFLKGNATIEDCQSDAESYRIDPNAFVYFHFGFAVKTSILRQMRGYDEDYKKMYCADKDLYGRLIANGIRPTMDQQCSPVHLWHTVPWYPNTEVTKRDYAEMKALFETKNASDFVRNDDSWGEGD